MLEGAEADGTLNGWTFSDILPGSFTWAGHESRTGTVAQPADARHPRPQRTDARTGEGPMGYPLLIRMEEPAQLSREETASTMATMPVASCYPRSRQAAGPAPP